MPGHQLGLRVEYDTDVFDADGIEVLIERFARLLIAMTSDPARRLSAVDLLDEPEHARLDGWGNRVVLTEASVTGESVPALFAAQVERSPEAVALTCDGRSMTYRELDEAANRWRTCWALMAPARQVRRAADGAFSPGRDRNLGGAEDRGGVSAHRPGASAGADRFHARRRRADRRDHHRRTGRSVRRVRAACHRCRRPRRRVSAQHTTTGAGPGRYRPHHLHVGHHGHPKGVAVTHRNVVRLFDSRQVGLELAPGQVWTQCHSLAFDYSVWEIWVRCCTAGGWWWCRTR
ncbi:AMP-binding enzyme family protein [Mycobacterium xenopi 4042]|uniref:AMP-binding enzyme family protein n=1 Tax=Mycobacterium xenopi 4042 TaxID=1299334 RepID=X8APG3_MYCXE|nr:AMP-binding enzyme family protein [Mycobacterium xenopi 4042]